MNVTPQRVAVYRALLQAEDHPSPEELYRRVRRRMPSLSLATIYKALDALTRLGVAREVSVISERCPLGTRSATALWKRARAVPASASSVAVHSGLIQVNLSSPERNSLRQITSPWFPRAA